MAYKDVLALRKEGKLDEALQMAERDMAYEDNRWTRIALFWCLYDLHKAQSGEEQATTVARMEELVAGLVGEDGILKQCLEKARAAVSPHATVLDSAFSRAQEGHGKEAYDEVSALYDKQELEPFFFDKYGWIIYYALHQQQNGNIPERKKMLMRYLDLHLPRPALLHSLILSEAVHIKRSAPDLFRFSAFVNMWDINTMRDDDWKRELSNDGTKTFPALVEQVITAYVKEILTDPRDVPDNFIAVLDRAVEKWRRDDNLLRQRAQVYLKQGMKDEARDVYKRLVLSNGDKYYLWSELSELVDDDDVRIALLCKALSTRSPDEYLGKIRMRLATLLIAKKDYPWALAELTIARRTYEQNNWKTTAIESILRGIPSGTELVDNKERYAANISQADEYLIADIAPVLMVKTKQRVDEEMNIRTGRKRKVMKWTLVGREGKSVGVRPARFNLPENMPNGTAFSVRIVDERPVAVQPLASLPDDVDWIKTVKGPLRIKTKEGRRFAFVNNCYVHDSLLATFRDGEMVTACALRTADDKWQCLALSPLPLP